MKKITLNDPESQSADILAENIQHLKALFPEAWVEDKIDFDVLKQLLGGSVEDREEKYGLNWHGKRQARQLALTPSTGTLRPCPEESVDWDTTQNLMIEGDNLEVLKLHQKSYAGKVKLIYIDPPYNTGKDFVYPDNYQDNIRNYLELTGQVEGGQKITTNPEASGRFHTDWLNMMYPRLKAARTILHTDGVIFISIDDKEIFHLRLAMDEIFGQENFIASFIWKSRQNKDNRTLNGASVDHEYVLCYGRSIKGSSRNKSQYTNPDNDPRGDWTSANMVGIATSDRRPNLHYDLINPDNGVNYGCPHMGWRYDKNTMNRLISENRIIWPTNEDGRPRRKSFLNDLESDYTGFSTIIGDSVYTRDGTADVNNLFGNRIFDFPKPTELIALLIEQGSQENDIVLDFFAGSGTTGHAVMAQNAADGGNRRYILVQLPEPLDPANKDQKTAAEFCDKLGKPRNIAELTKERLRRAGQKIRAELEAAQEQNPKNKQQPLFADSASSRDPSSLDLGFRVFKLDTSNIRPWSPDRDNLEMSLVDYVEHIKDDRSEADVLYELLLKLGLDLCVPMEQRVFAGKTVHSIGGGVLLVCLDKNISSEILEELAQGIVEWHKALAPVAMTTCVFRDNGFADDVVKTNLAAILHQHGLVNVRSL